MDDVYLDLQIQKQDTIRRKKTLEDAMLGSAEDEDDYVDPNREFNIKDRLLDVSLDRK